MSAKLGKTYSPTPLHYLMFTLQHLSEELLQEEAGVSLSHVRILGVLDSSFPVSQKLVAAKTRQTEANVSRQLLAMGKEGLVKVRKNSKDSRLRDVTLTAKGARRYQAAEKLLKKQLNEVYKTLTKTEKRVLDDSIAKITNSL